MFVGNNFYLGMKRNLNDPVEGFVWLDGTFLNETFNNFDDDDDNENQDVIKTCAVFVTENGKWRSKKCNSERYYMCQKLASKQP